MLPLQKASLESCLIWRKREKKIHLQYVHTAEKAQNSEAQKLITRL